MDIVLAKYVWENIINNAIFFAPNEVGGNIQIIEEKNRIIGVDIKIPIQQISPTEVEFKVESNHKNILFTFHSHVKEKTIASKTDTIEAHKDLLIFKTSIVLIVNIFGDYNCYVFTKGKAEEKKIII